MNLAVALGIRYAFSRRSALSFLSLVAITGLGLGVAVLVIIVSVMNGFERELRERVFGVLPHITLEARAGLLPESATAERLARTPDVMGVAPFVQGPGLAVGHGRSAGALIWGIDPAVQDRVSDLGKYIEWADQSAFEPGAFGVVLGAGLAERLGASPGDRVTLVLPSASVTPAGVVPRQKRFRVVGILRSRSEVDARAAIVHVADAQRLFRLGRRVDGWQLRVGDLFAVEATAGVALSLLDQPGVRATTWMRTHGNLYHAIGMQKSTMFVLLSFLIAVAAFNLVSTLVTVVNQRSGDVAILRTLGATSGLVVQSFVLLGLLLGGTGVVFGAGLGIAIASVLPELYAGLTSLTGRDLMSQYFVNYLPVEVRLDDLFGIVCVALVLCLLSTWYPAWRALRLRPSEVLAHE
ncbi:MAG: lipoprotein-releasing ABC transporter permease subunit [Pseudomonadales bacterium]